MFGTSESSMKKQVVNNGFPKGASTPSIIGPDVEIEGDISSGGEIQLDGRIRGNLICGALVMGESGGVDGDIKADEVTIRGRVNGDIRARLVQLEASAVTNGDVYHESLTVEAGAKLNGRFQYGAAAELAEQKAAAE